MKNRKRGSLLFIALIFSFISLLIIAGLIALWYHYTQVIFPVKVYTSIREAAKGSVVLIASEIDSGFFDEMEYGKCPSHTVIESSNSSLICCKIKLKYKLLESSQTFDIL